MRQTALDWYGLRGFARSGLGKASVLFPVLPFVVDLMLIGSRTTDAVGGASEKIRNVAPDGSTIDGALNKAADVWGGMFEGLQKFFHNNAGVLAGMYIGLGCFLAGKVLFEVAAPRIVKTHADIESARGEMLSLLNATSDRVVANHLRSEFFRVETNFKLSKFTNLPARFACSWLFYIAAVLLGAPAVFKMGQMFFVWMGWA